MKTKLAPPDRVELDTPLASIQTSLAYVTDHERGFKRRKAGKHFIFFDLDNNRIHDDAVVARIRKLAIPPAYRDVWICPKANGHIQATGIDARGRKQYSYHAQWRSFRDAAKFDRLTAFAEALSNIRQTIDEHTAQRGLGRDRLLATVVRLLEKTLIRVGNDEYAKNNGSYGLTTLTTKHVDVSGQTIRFMFKGKSGKQWQVKLSDRRIAAVIRKCEEIDGQELFKYADDQGHIHDVTSGDVNRYLRDIAGDAFTAKDFRTWAGTVAMAEDLSSGPPSGSEAETKKIIAAAIERTATRLGNTPAICRKCYVHPQIIAAFVDGDLNAAMKRGIPASLNLKYAGLSPSEINVMRLLSQRPPAAQ